MSNAILAELNSVRVKKCRHGLFMYNKYDKYVGRAFDEYGEFSELENTFFQQVIKPGMTAVDIGANIGAHTVSFAHHVGKVGQVIAFEPQRVVYQMLCGNVALNSLENVHALMAGVGSANGNITVPPLDYQNTNNFGGAELGAYSSGEVVPLVTLDSFGLAKCDFIKIDVEGMEREVIHGATETLKRCQPLIYVENDRPEKSEELILCILKHGYRLYWHMPAMFNPDNYFGNSQNVFGSLPSINMIGVPAGRHDIVTDVLQEATHDNAGTYILPDAVKPR